MLTSREHHHISFDIASHQFMISIMFGHCRHGSDCSSDCKLIHYLVCRNESDADGDDDAALVCKHGEQCRKTQEPYSTCAVQMSKEPTVH